MRIRTIITGIILSLSLTHCMSYDFSRRVVQQGNLLSHEKVTRLHLGMSKKDVAILMGTSLISPTFNDDRWDYANTQRKGSSALRIRHLSLYFTNDKLTRMDVSTNQAPGR